MSDSLRRRVCLSAQETPNTFQWTNKELLLKEEKKKRLAAWITNVWNSFSWLSLRHNLTYRSAHFLSPESWISDRLRHQRWHLVWCVSTPHPPEMEPITDLGHRQALWLMPVFIKHTLDLSIVYMTLCHPVVRWLWTCPFMMVALMQGCWGLKLISTIFPKIHTIAPKNVASFSFITNILLFVCYFWCFCPIGVRGLESNQARLWIY